MMSNEQPKGWWGRYKERYAERRRLQLETFAAVEAQLAVSPDPFSRMLGLLFRAWIGKKTPRED